MLRGYDNEHFAKFSPGNGVGRFGQIVLALQLLGDKYRGLGIEEFHYGAVGEALLWTLKQSLGAHWSPDIEDAWAAAFTAIAETMTGSD